MTLVEITTPMRSTFMTIPLIVSPTRMLEALKNYDAFKAAHDSDPAVQLVKSFQEKISISTHKQKKKNQLNRKASPLLCRA